jgi:hypothetical protein
MTNMTPFKWVDPFIDIGGWMGLGFDPNPRPNPRQNPRPNPRQNPYK